MKFLLPLILIFTFVLVGFGQIKLAESSIKGRVITPNGFVKESRSNNSPTIFTLNQNDLVPLSSNQHTKGWYMVVFYLNNTFKTGWISGNEIKIEKPRPNTSFILGDRDTDVSTPSSSLDTLILEKLNKPDSRWNLLVKDDSLHFLADTLTVNQKGVIKEVWIKRISQTIPLPYAPVIKTLYSFNCAARTYQSLVTSNYDKYMNVLNSPKGAGDINRVVPDSLGEALYIRVCLNEITKKYYDEYEEQNSFKVISGGVVNGKAVNLIKPVYPPAAKAARVTGSVNVQVSIDENGRVMSAEAVSGHELLRNVSEKAALESTFSPTIVDGVRVRVTGVIVYSFTAQ